MDRKTADTTIPWHGMSEGPECVVFNSHTSTDYVLEGAELSASSDSWAGNWVCRGRAAWLRSETPLGPGLISAVLRLPPPVEALWPAVRLLHRGNGRAPAPAWWALTNGCFFESWRARLRRSVFYFPPACLGWAFVRLPGFAVLPTWWCAMGLERLSFVLLSNKSWWFTNKKVKIVFWWSLEAYGESVAIATFSAMCRARNNNRQTKDICLFVPPLINNSLAIVLCKVKQVSIGSAIDIKIRLRTHGRLRYINVNKLMLYQFMSWLAKMHYDVMKGSRNNEIPLVHVLFKKRYFYCSAAREGLQQQSGGDVFLTQLQNWEVCNNKTSSCVWNCAPWQFAYFLQAVNPL